MANGCPYVEDKTGIACFENCKAERLDGHWKVCADSRFDPLIIVRVNSLEVSATGLCDEEGRELYEVYQGSRYFGSCYATSEQEAEAKAASGQLLDELTA